MYFLEDAYNELDLSISNSFAALLYSVMRSLIAVCFYHFSWQLLKKNDVVDLDLYWLSRRRYLFKSSQGVQRSMPIFRIRISLEWKVVIKWYMVCFHCLLKDFHAVKISILMVVELRVFVSLFSSWMIRLKRLLVLTWDHHSFR